MAKIKLITKSEFAREMNISPQRVHSLIKRGIIQVRKDGKINFDRAKKILEDNRATSPKMKNISYSDARARHEMLKIEMAQIELRQRKRDLIERGEVIKICSDIITISKTRLLAIPTKLAPQIVGVDSIRKIKSILEKEIRQALDELSRTKYIS